MKIPISMLVHDQIISTQALIDSGAEGQFIDAKFVIKHRIPTQPLAHPITILNANGTTNKHGTITCYMWRSISINGKTMPTTFKVTSLGKEDIILGLPWLKRTNPVINWLDGTITIAKVTTATSLTQEHVQEAKLLTDMIPQEYHHYLDIFRKQSAEHFQSPILMIMPLTLNWTLYCEIAKSTPYPQKSSRLSMSSSRKIYAKATSVPPNRQWHPHSFSLEKKTLASTHARITAP
ncbi:hypothetical protein M0805_004206 [Coniferiporia weirii]|nr:hypothetical protein M0805_004206 [Coniferiporia weirii]